MRFDLVDLQLFLHVAEAANITHGAERSNLALASASGRIRKMEELAGTPLIERGRRGVMLTLAGRALAHHARLVIHQIGHMKGELSEYAGGIKGRVRVQANASALSEFLPKALSEFLTDNPGIDVDLEESSSYRIVRAVADGFVEIGIVADIVDFGDLEFYPFAIDRLVLITPREGVAESTDDAPNELSGTMPDKSVCSTDRWKPCGAPVFERHRFFRA